MDILDIYILLYLLKLININNFNLTLRVVTEKNVKFIKLVNNLIFSVFFGAPFD